MEACAKKQEVQDTKVERRLLGKNLRVVRRKKTCSAPQERKNIMKDMTKKINQKKGWMPRTDGVLLS